MTILQSLTEAATAGAMSIAEMHNYWHSRARCVRCIHYDEPLQTCKTALLRGVRIRDASKFRCISFKEQP